MQKLVILSVFAFWAAMANAQDRIVTVKQDTIECRIISAEGEQIKYEQKSANGYIVRKIISMDQVAAYSYRQTSSGGKSSRRPELPWLIRVNPGGSWMPWLYDNTGNASDDEKSLANGFHVNASWNYLFTHSFGVGVQYSFLQSSSKGESLAESHYLYPVYTKASAKEKQYINYVGASLLLRCFLDENKKFQLSGTLSAGVIFYHGESKISADIVHSSGYSIYNMNSLLTGRTFGATCGFSVEYYITPSLSIGVGGDFLYGALKKVDAKQNDSNGNNYTVKGGKLNEAMKLSRLDYSLALSIHF